MPQYECKNQTNINLLRMIIQAKSKVIEKLQQVRIELYEFSNYPNISEKKVALEIDLNTKIKNTQCMIDNNIVPINTMTTIINIKSETIRLLLNVFDYWTFYSKVDTDSVESNMYLKMLENFIKKESDIIKILQDDTFGKLSKSTICDDVNKVSPGCKLKSERRLEIIIRAKSQVIEILQEILIKVLEFRKDPNALNKTVELENTLNCMTKREHDMLGKQICTNNTLTGINTLKSETIMLLLDVINNWKSYMSMDTDDVSNTYLKILKNLIKNESAINKIIEKDELPRPLNLYQIHQMRQLVKNQNGGRQHTNSPPVVL
jgi:hypothetical protein